MKKINKFLATLISLLCMFSVVTPVLAEGEETGTSSEEQVEVQDSEGEEEKATDESEVEVQADSGSTSTLTATCDHFDDITVQEGTNLIMLLPWPTFTGNGKAEWYWQTSKDGGKTWEDIFMKFDCEVKDGATGVGGDTAPIYLTVQDSGIKVRTVVNDITDSNSVKELYNHSITVTVFGTTVDTTEGTPKTGVYADLQTILESFSETLSGDELSEFNAANKKVGFTAEKVEPSAEIKSLIDNQLAGSDKVALYLDLGVNISYKKSDGSEKKFEVANTGAIVSFTITLDDSLVNSNSAYDRTYQVIRVHDGKAEVLKGVSYDASTKQLTFYSDKFSTYAIAYSDTKKDSKTPATSDTNNIVMYSLLAGMAVIVGLGVIVLRKKFN